MLLGKILDIRARDEVDLLIPFGDEIRVSCKPVFLKVGQFWEMLLEDLKVEIHKELSVPTRRGKGNQIVCWGQSR